MENELAKNILLEQRFGNQRKSLAMAYILAWFGGVIGLHNLYLDDRQNAVIKLIIFIVSCLLAFVVVGILGFIALFIWVVIDIFALADKTAACNEYIKFKIKKDLDTL